MIKEEQNTKSLAETDYLSILECINHFNSCFSRNDLKKTIEKHLMPLLNAQGAMFGLLDPDLKSIRYLDTVGYSLEDALEMQKMMPHFKTLNRFIVETQRKIFSNDLDQSRNLFHQEKKLFLEKHPEYKGSKFTTKAEACLSLIDRPDHQLAFGIHRWSPNIEEFGSKDIRILELIQPHMVNKIKSILITEELSRFHAFTESLVESSTAIALVSLDYQIIFCNTAFESLMSISKGQKLPDEFNARIKQETAKINATVNMDSPNLNVPFLYLKAGLFRFSINLLNSDKNRTEQCWMIRLKPVKDPYSKKNIFMQESGLTPREIEVAALAGDGVDDQDIADRLFISYHTVRNHLKKIYAKLDIHSRAQLVAAMNQES